MVPAVVIEVRELIKDYLQVSVQPELCTGHGSRDMRQLKWPRGLGGHLEEVMSRKQAGRAFSAEDTIHAKAQRGPDTFGELQILEH